ncbi:S-DNA-T family DNA segregation ATPase FtsK/SpoIIIE [Murinocardiopsis flavida]|uniref:S-DNA-T family DNA segregation ATPase FtsK/SpoIIIE n=1 Tax=Murinocardiopsis flavida TaxID=645275 RepID=A0A2P8DPZ6_9ACTN|nr:FtsK/SpoIIIE domain-containing protein [Murinocardiopsis flavida]PSK99296.1 S-DNA-T family DNA segregation ATPase FtsK/SpoIIIE [Murinocardiopsis flavida]
MLGGSTGEAQKQPTAPIPAQTIRFTVPVVETPGIFVIARWVWALVRLLVLLPVRAPVTVALVVSSALILDSGGWVPLAASWTIAVAVLVLWWWRWPHTFCTRVALPALAKWRWLTNYRRHWQPVLVVAGLAESYQERRYLPRIRRVTCTEWADRVRVKIVPGTTPEDFQTRVDALAHGFAAPSCRVHVNGARDVTLEFPRRDTLAEPLDALPVHSPVDLRGVAMGRTEEGDTWRLRLHGTHVLTVGVTGAGKGSVIWSAIRALTPAIGDGSVQVWAIDPKRMELSYGRPLFAHYADSGESAVDLLEQAVARMQERAARYAGKQRTHTPSPTDPFVVVVVDEVAFLTAYHPDRDVRRRAENAIATLTSQGRSVGVCVLAALQDPRKEVMNLRNLFPDKIALRLDEASQVDMVLGEGARERGANAHLIDPYLPGVGFVKLEGSPVPVRVRAAFVTDEDIAAMAAQGLSSGREVER